MNSHSLAQRAYAPTQAPIKTARSTEYDVIAQITYRLKRAIQKRDFPALLEALHDNNKLWMALALDAADEANLLPDELRARIVYLADFTRQHSHKVMQKKDTPLPLLEINAAVMKGLKQEEPGK